MGMMGSVIKLGYRKRLSRESIATTGNSVRSQTELQLTEAIGLTAELNKWPTNVNTLCMRKITRKPLKVYLDGAIRVAFESKKVRLTYRKEELMPPDPSKMSVHLVYNRTPYTTFQILVIDN